MEPPRTVEEYLALPGRERTAARRAMTPEQLVALGLVEESPLARDPRYAPPPRRPRTRTARPDRAAGRRDRASGVPT